MRKTLVRFATVLAILALVSGSIALARPSTRTVRAQQRSFTEKINKTELAIRIVDSRNQRSIGNLDNLWAWVQDRLGLRALRTAAEIVPEIVPDPRSFVRYGLSDTPDPTGVSDEDGSEDNDDQQDDETTRPFGY